MPAQPKFLKEIIGNLPRIQITDVGAAPIEEEQPYKPLLESGIAELTCFEPQKDQFEKLAAEGNPRVRYLPHAVGDGEEHTFHICRAPGMTSFLEPDMDVLSHFHGFPDWGTVVRKEGVKTLRLDDIPEVRDTHYLKMDIQGFELTVLQNAPRVLENAVAVQSEAIFIPLYKN